MYKALRVSLLYLLIIIPQHGNSPIPRLESWTEMDEDDGFIDRDLTSSLTGAESFGSAHKNYQNALIRKKQTNIEGELSRDGEVDKISGEISDRVQRRAEIAPNFMQNQYESYGYDNLVSGSVPNQQICQEPVNGYQDLRCRMQLSNSNGHASNSRFDRRFYGSGLADLMDSTLTATYGRPLQAENDGLREVRTSALSPRLAKYSVGETEKFDPESAAADVLSNREVGADETDYETGSEQMSNRVKSGQNEYYVTNVAMENGEERDRDLMRYNENEEDDLVSNESDYYGDGRNPASAGDDASDDFDVDYGQVNPNRIIYKREEMKIADAKLKEAKESGSHNLLKAEAPKEGRDIAKVDANGRLCNSKELWTTNSNEESSDAEKALRYSRTASQKIRKSREKSEANPEYYRDSLYWVRDGYGKEWKRTPQETRNKREDEDEQKNMKTGTDEGGGEYEDEEGKGHNDEEDYYEEGEFSTGEISSHHNCNRKFYKRETGKDEEEKGKKDEEGNTDISLAGYQLNLDNAPVEHEENCKKCSWHEGKSRKKSVARRGMKIWDEWGKWSPCSVTCGVGRKTRWRHCIGGGCARGEKEALIKKCTFPAC